MREINSGHRFGGAWGPLMPFPCAKAGMDNKPADGPIAVGGPWNEFSFASAGTLAKGCAPADPSGLGCVPKRQLAAPLRFQLTKQAAAAIPCLASPTRP